MKYLISFIIFANSFNIYMQTLNKNDDYLILNSYLKNESNISLIKENYFNGSTLRYFGFYERWYKVELRTKDLIDIKFNGKVDWIFSEEDLEYMKSNYYEWNIGFWDKTKIKRDVNLIDSERNKYGMSPNIRISYPFYDKTKTKAMIVVSKTSSPLNGSTNIVLFKKNKKGKWKNVGKLFISIS